MHLRQNDKLQSIVDWWKQTLSMKLHVILADAHHVQEDPSQHNRDIFNLVEKKNASTYGENSRRCFLLIRYSLSKARDHNLGRTLGCCWCSRWVVEGLTLFTDL